ncbi:hypothetical protein T492DRAFT_917879 [Pavlovales sp. CCMP2436]|nr:hypothetical protein T492DRAFT_917879 [Pavlovales sp. CCMP2436]
MLIVMLIVMFIPMLIVMLIVMFIAMLIVMLIVMFIPMLIGSALNMIHDEKEFAVLQQIESYFDRKGLIKEIPPDTDGEEFEKILNVQ